MLFDFSGVVFGYYCLGGWFCFVFLFISIFVLFIGKFSLVVFLFRGFLDVVGFVILFNVELFS